MPGKKSIFVLIFVQMNSIDWIGFIGVFLILLAFYLNIRDKLSHTDLTYILLNLVGALMACFASILLNYIPFVILEGIWAVVSLISLFNYLVNEKK